MLWRWWATCLSIWTPFSTVLSTTSSRGSRFDPKTESVLLMSWFCPLSTCSSRYLSDRIGRGSFQSEIDQQGFGLSHLHSVLASHKAIHKAVEQDLFCAFCKSSTHPTIAELSENFKSSQGKLLYCHVPWCTMKFLLACHSSRPHVTMQRYSQPKDNTTSVQHSTTRHKNTFPYSIHRRSTL